MFRKTIKNRITLEGTGLHKGTPARVTFLPAPGSSGIRFISPLFSSPIPALLENVSGTARGTNIGDGKNILYTVEHLLSAAAGLGVDDLDIEISGLEPPAMDGSALPFAKALLEAGMRDKPGSKRSYARLAAPVEFSKGETRYRAEPAASGAAFRLVYEYPHPLVGRQAVEFCLSPEIYLKEIAPARTFAFSHEIKALKAAGLALGGSLENAVLIDETEILAHNGLRFADEFARHKLLDLIGDLALTGLFFEGLIIEAERPGHAGNVNFAKLLVNHSARAL
ncbi:MAG: UDP-3-O-acyl-N-acetylglucosamine deacetylase [Elusimicrobia bacterium]|nr:UDP-3-O-acyl-N-acetylglucosamine deacetylase [Elusimicrobiota bacterium]